jgi:autonomous glycyl radical cofactor GrcA
MNKIISIDAETNGLWGNPFAIAAIVYEKRLKPHYMSGWEAIGYEWKEVDRIVLRLPDSFVTEPWVIEIVLPTLAGIKSTHDSYEKMLNDFAHFYMSNKFEATVLYHMGHVVEAFLFREMVRLGYIGHFDAPYLPIDVANDLRLAGEQADSVDKYAAKYGLKVSDYGTTHNPLYDCEIAAKVFFHLHKD